MCVDFLWGNKFRNVAYKENYEGRIDGHSNSNSNLLGLGLNIHGSFVSRSSPEKSMIWQNDICIIENKSLQRCQVNEARAEGASDFF